MTNETIQTIRSRRSCRAYKPEQITNEELEAVLGAGTYAASAMGKQSAKIVVVQDAATEISRLIVKNQKARQALGKEIGTYITIELPSLTDNFTETDKRLETVGNEIKRLLPVNGLVLVAGLGNMEITPDSLGPKTSRRVLATRHIGGEIARSTGLDRLRPVAVMQTGVTGQTGIETGEYILSIVRRIRPTAVVAIDALASRRTERLGCTLQISDTGISPGAGVGNHRTKITKETIGVPVIAIGVPTRRCSPWSHHCRPLR